MSYLAAGDSTLLSWPTPSHWKVATSPAEEDPEDELLSPEDLPLPLPGNLISFSYKVQIKSGWSFLVNPDNTQKERTSCEVSLRRMIKFFISFRTETTFLLH